MEYARSAGRAGWKLVPIASSAGPNREIRPGPIDCYGVLPVDAAVELVPAAADCPASPVLRFGLCLLGRVALAFAGRSPYVPEGYGPGCFLCPFHGCGSLRLVFWLSREMRTGPAIAGPDSGSACNWFLFRLVVTTPGVLNYLLDLPHCRSDPVDHPCLVQRHMLVGISL